MGGGKVLIVQKYGGTSVGSVERIKAVAQRVADTVAEGHRCVVVVSAMGDTTDQLVEMARQITARPSGREMDMLLTTGEQVSIALLSMALQELGQRTTSYTGWQAGIRTEAVHGKARIEEINTEKIMKALDDGQIVIVAGFQGVTEAGEITTLGRGGSDTTAVALAAALQADLCEIYTDVTGVFTTDPRVVPGARKLPSVSYDEMLELAILGAGVLHPRAVECAKLYNVKLVVRSSFTDEEGTMIQGVSDMEKALVVTGIAFDDEVVKVQVDGLPNRVDAMAQLFTLLAQERINVDVIVQSQRGEDEINLAFSITEEDRLNAEEVLKANQEQLGFSKASFESGLAKVSIVGAGMMTNPGVAAMCFRYLSEAGIPIKMVTTSEIKVSCVIPREWMETAVKRLHEAFGLESGSCASVSTHIKILPKTE
ncbi:MAG: aspartate kinase [Bacillus thermozeamaize]|uniref:Aspartokinase n=1 Tax=Bacillus thermozeamaize TaxID=230954 RepID=A0A1Y3PIJ2_9BACI|nr:MAG: aspartate kinase [Bacillus thermozeamaize]